MKLLYIGFDGFDPFIAKDLGMLPDFQTVYSYSDVPITGPAWTSLNTGLTVEHHGISESWGRPKDGATTFMSTTKKYLWDYLNDAGLSCGLMNIPITWPPKVVNGWMVSGPFVPSRENICFPPGLIDTTDYWPDLINEFFERRNFNPTRDDPDNYPDYNQPGMLRDIGFVEAHNMAKEQSRKRLQLLDEAYKKHPVDCMFYQDSFLDRMNHAFPQDVTPGTEELTMLYARADEVIQHLKKYKADVTVIVSDHGGHSGRHENGFVWVDDVRKWVTSHGIFAIKSDNTPANQEVCDIIDVTPTILYSLGIYGPIQEKQFDGKVCYGLFHTPDEKAVEQQLKGLGYL